MSQQFITYTYQTVAGQLDCHAYGPTGDRAQAQGEGENRAAASPGLAFMVLALEPMTV